MLCLAGSSADENGMKDMVQHWHATGILAVILTVNSDIVYQHAVGLNDTARSEAIHLNRAHALPYVTGHNASNPS